MKILKAIILASCFSTTACAQTNEALIGGAIGAIIGDGTGHQREATIIGATAGYLVGESSRNNRYYRERVYEYDPYYYERQYRYPRETIIYYPPPPPVYREVYYPRPIRVYQHRHYYRYCRCR